jgi:hypothetical protein
MNNNQPSLFLYYIGFFLGLFLGTFVIYISTVKGNLLLSEKDYICVDAEPVDTDPSIVACTIVLRKGSTPYKKYLEMSNEHAN